MTISTKQAGLLFALIFAFFVGIEFEFEMWVASSLPDFPIHASFLLLSGTFLYNILVFAFISFLGIKWDEQHSTLSLMFFYTTVATGWLIAFINDFSETIIENYLPAGPAAGALVTFSGALIEEVIKLLFVYLIIKASGKSNLSFVFLTGCLVGLGFQLTEDVSYIFSSEEVSECFVNLLSKLSGAFSSHWIYTGVTSFGFYLLSQKINRGWFYIGVIILSHTVWNSSLNVSSVTSSLLSSLTISLFIYCILQISSRQSSEQSQWPPKMIV